MTAYRRDAGFFAVLLWAILIAFFAPYAAGYGSLMSSSSESHSLYPGGALPGNLVLRTRGPDPRAPAWFMEPTIALEHRLLFEDHQLPFWDPYDGYGIPLAAQMQSQPFYPPTLLLSIAPSPLAFNWWVLFRLFTAGFFTALFVRLFADRASAALSGAAAMLSGYFLSYYNMPFVSTECVFPMVLWATELCCRRATPLRVATLAIAAGLVYHGGMPESAALDMTFAGLYGIIRLGAAADRRGAALSLISGHALGIALAAVLLLPLAELVPLSSNTHSGLTGLIIERDWPQRLLTELVPLAYDGNFARGFVGCAVFFLAAVAVFGIRRAGERLPVMCFCLAAIAYSVLKHFGSPLVQWTGALPIYNLIIFPKYVEPVTGVCMAILAGFGLAALRENRVARRRIAFALGATAAAVCFLVIAQTVRAVAGFAFDWSAAIVPGCALLAAVYLSFALSRPKMPDARRAFATWAMVGVVALEPFGGWIVPIFLHSVQPAAANPYAGAPYLTFLDRHVNKNSERVAGLGGYLYPNWAGAYGLADPRVFDALVPKGYYPLIQTFLRPARPSEELQPNIGFFGTAHLPLSHEAVRRWYALSSVRYVVAGDPAHAPEIAPFAQRVYASAAASVYKLPRALDRLSIFHQARLAQSQPAAIETLEAPDFDIYREVSLESPLAAGGANAPGERVDVVSSSSESLVVDVALLSSGIVMQNDVFYPGWQARVDGIETPIVRADGYFRAVAIPAGKHRLELVYRPRSISIGIFVSLAALLIVALLGGLGARTALRDGDARRSGA